jgi:hypothetical protein
MSDAESKKSLATEIPKGVPIDLNEIYKIDPSRVVSDITHVRYSNMAYIQVTERDVFIDFLEMPGVKKDGKQTINGTRIYMSHAAAQRLSEAMGKILDEVHRSKKMETYFARTSKK